MILIGKTIISDTFVAIKATGNISLDANDVSVLGNAFEVNSGVIFMNDLIGFDPEVQNEVYNSAGALKVSAGG